MLDALKPLLRALEQKQSRMALLIAIRFGGRARWTPRVVQFGPEFTP